MKTILIGDLHGCYDEAIDLLDAVAACASDRVIFLGDLVDRGPQPRECVDLAMKHECLLGNHEEKHLQIRQKREVDLSPDHARTRRALATEHYEYFARLPLFILLPEYGAAAIHAGALPGIPIPSQDLSSIACTMHQSAGAQELLAVQGPSYSLVLDESLAWPGEADFWALGVRSAARERARRGYRYGVRLRFAADRARLARLANRPSAFATSALDRRTAHRINTCSRGCARVLLMCVSSRACEHLSSAGWFSFWRAVVVSHRSRLCNRIQSRLHRSCRARPLARAPVWSPLPFPLLMR